MSVIEEARAALDVDPIRLGGIARGSTASTRRKLSRRSRTDAQSSIAAGLPARRWRRWFSVASSRASDSPSPCVRSQIGARAQGWRFRVCRWVWTPAVTPAIPRGRCPLTPAPFLVPGQTRGAVMTTTVSLSVSTTNGGTTNITVTATDSGGNPRFNSLQVEELTATLTARVRAMFEGEHGFQEPSA